MSTKVSGLVLGITKGWYENGHTYYLNDRDRYGNDHRHGYFQDLAIRPVDLVKTYATQYGFNPDLDSFTLIHEGRHKATVLVTSNATGQRFKIDLERNRGDWQIAVIRGIGDAFSLLSFHSETLNVK